MTMLVDAQPLLRRIERYLRTARVAPTRFGIEAASDPRLVFDLRRGRELRSATHRRITVLLDILEAA